MERFKGDRPVNMKQRFDEVNTMLGFLDTQGDLTDYTTRLRERDGNTEWAVQLNGVPVHKATIRSTHAYLAGACDVVILRDNTEDPRQRMCRTCTPGAARGGTATSGVPASGPAE